MAVISPIMSTFRLQIISAEGSQSFLNSSARNTAILLLLKSQPAPAGKVGLVPSCAANKSWRGVGIVASEQRLLCSYDERNLNVLDQKHYQTVKITENGSFPCVLGSTQ
ncbi:hypothetical protein EON65_07140 [archaeon]|nr:MAG: hypothetical protein EON65_07140 [archaeon]